ncbi:lipid-binding SYLF domain-containing protein [Campylobacter sp. RM16192]|uniref:lipid-binding SYLF domain-containing protein n=1 Tax=Campylobacter sp. RM16192 TaxID=1660080 RepID=UPI001553B9CB|nr:lipid-binding SYLF domain-containing protein [Campylobacter sp. RM16192]
MKKILMLIFGISLLFSNDELVLDASNSFTLTMRKNSGAPINALMQNAKAVVIFPKVTKVGLILGGMHGNGIMVVGSPYSPSEIWPVSISGGSVGLQIGYENSSLVIFILKESIVSDIKDAKITLKADASFAFGEIGQNYGKISDFKFSSSIYAYASNDGFFAGASFGGAVISKSDTNELNKNSYGYSSLLNSFSKF